LAVITPLVAGLLVSPFGDDPAQTLGYEKPAEKFYEAMPLGNGRIGALVFGGTREERIVLNESTLWSGSPYDADRKDAHKSLPEIRRLLLEGKNKEAQQLVQKTFVCQGPGSSYGHAKDAPYGAYQVFGNLRLNHTEGPGQDPRLGLYLPGAFVVVGEITTAFVSKPDEVFVYSNPVWNRSFTLTFDRAENCTITSKGNTISVRGQLKSGQPGIEGVRFAGEIRVVLNGGTVEPVGNGLKVSPTHGYTIIASLGTSMFDKGFEKTVGQRLESATKKSHGNLWERHRKDFEKFYNRSRIELPQAGSASQKPTDERLVNNAKGAHDPSLAALYYNFGRYLMISASRPDSPLPMNLQGIWAEELQTPWNADFHLNINLQMNYWPAEITGLGDCAKPLFEFTKKMVPNGSKTAKAYYDAPGWVAHFATNPWFFTSPGEDASWGSTVSCGAWLSAHMWDHYAFTGDKKFLKDVYPTMKGAAEFFLSMLIKEPKHGWLVTAPSNSPENAFKLGDDNLTTCMGPTIDNQIVRELFTNVHKSAKILGLDEEFAKKLEQTIPQLAPTRLGPDGRIMEWLEPYPEPEPKHRHVSHLYGLHPAFEIDVDKTPALAEGARKTLAARGDDGTGWSLAWKINFWARLRDGEHALLQLNKLLRPTGSEGFNYSNGGGTYKNLFDAHPPFQIDGNFGATAGIAEMLMQSQPGEIILLPALPKAWAKEGEVKGFRARGGLTVDFKWEDGKIVSHHVRGPGANKVKVKGPGL
jgi:alpha-L-fucosidase 2